MKTLLSVAAAVVVLASPIASFASTTDAPVTRAEVRTQLVQLENAGYTVGGGEDLNYPVGIQAAETRVENGQTVKAASTHPVARFFKTASHKLSKLDHASPSSCVGPADFCTPYFGG